MKKDVAKIVTECFMCLEPINWVDSKGKDHHRTYTTSYGVTLCLKDACFANLAWLLITTCPDLRKKRDLIVQRLSKLKSSKSQVEEDIYKSIDKLRQNAEGR